MQASEVLTVVAEISIGLAGFTGIVVAYRQRGLDELMPHELVRLRFMLGLACTTLLFALFPFLPYYLGLDPPAVWRASSVTMAVGLVAVSVITHLRTRAHLDRLSAAWRVSYIAGSGLFAAVGSVNALAIAGPTGPGLYLACLGWLLFMGLSLFVRLILASVSPN